MELFPEEKVQILNLLPHGTSSEDKESVYTILSQIHTGMTSEEDISDQDQVHFSLGYNT